MRVSFTMITISSLPRSKLAKKEGIGRAQLNDDDHTPYLTQSQTSYCFPCNFSFNIMSLFIQIYMQKVEIEQTAEAKKQHQSGYYERLLKSECGKSWADIPKIRNMPYKDSSIASDLSEKYRDAEADIQSIEQSCHKLLSVYAVAVQKERPLYQINLLVDMLASNKEKLKKAKEAYADFRRQLKKCEENYEHLKAVNAFY